MEYILKSGINSLEYKRQQLILNENHPHSSSGVDQLNLQLTKMKTTEFLS